jgi:ribosomal protein S18 acetylase RimI-like enzyme
MTIRAYQPGDLETMQRITVAGFDGTAIEQHIERLCGTIDGHDWRWRKAREIEEDCRANPHGVFVAEERGKVCGFITTRVDRNAGKGRIPNLAVEASAQGRGLGRQLIEHALNYFRAEGLAAAVIETMANNEAGQHLYPSCGFSEIARQIHYAMKL